MLIPERLFRGFDGGFQVARTARGVGNVINKTSGPERPNEGRQPMSSVNPASPAAAPQLPAKRAAPAPTQEAVLAPRGRPAIRVAVLDEPGIMRDGLCALLADSPDFEIVAILTEAAEMAAAVEKNRPDVMIVDFSHSNNVGHEVIAAAKARHPTIRVLVLTFRKDDNVIDSALRAGADGYVLKNDSRNDLFMALRNIAAGRGYISPSICDRVMSGYVRARDPGRTRTAMRGELTERERQVMRLIAAGHRTREMASLLSLSYKTVEKHRANLMRKLGLRNASAVAAYAIANGFVSF
jgi:DNA-binding NarL/FixJ family response regulator